MPLKIRAPTIDKLSRLSDLCFGSKAVWGYDEDFMKVPHGAAFLDPEGKTRYKPIRNDEDFMMLPEGAKFADPSGKIRTKPKYEPIDFTPQTLYDIAHSDKGRKMALEKFYPGKVREDPSGGFYIEDDDGKWSRQPC